ncbi:hypothetical protein ABZU86_26785 [Streptomyces sp. NPDC005271]|uniref:hypothetical protein n=1 Tax=unclassified Streptomyces TaxID=2593676 RepID=UPI0033A934F3
MTERTPQTVILVGGTASTTFSPLPKGTHTVTAHSNGDGSFSSSSVSITRTVPPGQG